MLTLGTKILYSIFLNLRAKIFNDLPIEARKHCKEKNFNSILKNNFFS